jgi:hypothetical protein
MLRYAGINATICENGSYDLTDATAGNYESLSWSGGAGTFTPSFRRSLVISPKEALKALIKAYNNNPSQAAPSRRFIGPIAAPYWAQMGPTNPTNG